jgi:ATP-dependent Lon protease
MEQFSINELELLTKLIRDDIMQTDVIYPEDLLDDGNRTIQHNNLDIMSLLRNKYVFDTIESRQKFMSDFMSANDNNKKNSDLMFLAFLKILAYEGYMNEDIKKQILIVYDSYDSRNEKLIIFKNLICAFPWEIFKRVNTDTVSIECILDNRLYGMQDAKEKIIELLVLHIHSKRPVPEPLLLHGPPGVGKTSFAMAIAEALNLPLIKISLAGVHDVSVFSGSSVHWSSSTPGMIVREFAGAGCLNPVVLIDEIDKCGGSSAGRVTDILAEMLNPEQSCSFRDLFLGVPVDLSNALYICTANDVNKIPWFVEDRCETIFVPGYTSNERKEIVGRHMVKQIAQKYGFNFDIAIDDSAIDILTKVESLRQIKRIVRSGIARCLKNNKSGHIVVSSEHIMHEFINPKWFEERNKEDAKCCNM